MGKGHGKAASAAGERYDEVARAVGAAGTCRVASGGTGEGYEVVHVQLQGTQGVRFCMEENTHLYFFQA